MSVAHATRAVNSDFEAWWRAAQLWLSGIDPYTARLGSAAWPFSDPFFYPFPAVLLSIPVARLALPIAAGLTLGIATAALSWALTREGLWRLWLLVNPGFLMAAKVGQWSPLLVAGTLVPVMGFVLAAKPTIGAACFIYRPRWESVVGVAALLTLSLVVHPRWPAEWMHNLGHLDSHPAPVFTPLGCLALLALVRWRQPEARLLVAMACVPQLLFFADQLPLGLVARTRKEATLLSACGLAAFLLWWTALQPGDLYVLKATPYVLLGCYLPALLIVLSRPNKGDVPQWLETAITRLRTRLPHLRSPRGTPTQAEPRHASRDGT